MMIMGRRKRILLKPDGIGNKRFVAMAIFLDKTSNGLPGDGVRVPPCLVSGGSSLYGSKVRGLILVRSTNFHDWCS